MDYDSIEKFRGHGKEMIDYLCTYNETLDQIPVAPNVEPGFLVGDLAGLFITKSKIIGS